MPIPFFHQPAPQPQYVPQPAPRMPAPTYPPPQAIAPPGGNGWNPTSSPVLAEQAAQINQPKVRGAAPEPAPIPVPRTLSLPSPEQLGLARQGNPPPAQTNPMVDWNALHARLRQLGATGLHLDTLPGGVVRVTVLVPAADGETRPVEAIASTESAAVETLWQRIGR
jgi:hypothetical protein